jgi:Uri superfamily endonuclease
MLLLLEDYSRQYREEAQEGMRKRPYNVGIYGLIIHVPRQETIRIGRLGPVSFDQGIYVYIGSALNSLKGRISRHFRKTKRKHWHIDHLVESQGVRLAGVATRPTTQRLECLVSRAVARRALSSISRFGCSDCKCASHLHRFETFSRASKTLSSLSFHTSLVNSHRGDGSP